MDRILDAEPETVLLTEQRWNLGWNIDSRVTQNAPSDSPRLIGVGFLVHSIYEDTWKLSQARNLTRNSVPYFFSDPM